jgi:hypothetical protein
MLAPGDGSLAPPGRDTVKKKTTKRLVLAKETVRSLEELALVRGGATEVGGTGLMTASCHQTDCNYDIAYITQVGC